MLSPAETEALLLSLRISAVAVLCALPLAIALAALLAHRRFPGKTIIDGALHLPMVLPPVVVGYLLLIVLGTRAPVGAWLLEHLGIRFAFSWTGAALVLTLYSFCSPPARSAHLRISIPPSPPLRIRRCRAS